MTFLFSPFTGIALAGGSVGGSPILVVAGLMFFAMSPLPGEASGVMPLRLVEPAFPLYAALAIAEMFAVKLLLEITIQAAAKVRAALGTSYSNHKGI